VKGFDYPRVTRSSPVARGGCIVSQSGCSHLLLCRRRLLLSDILSGVLSRLLARFLALAYEGNEIASRNDRLSPRGFIHLGRLCCIK